MRCQMQLPRSCLPALTRGYASSVKRRQTNLRNTISLDHFLQRSKALALWRSIVRGSRRIADEKTKKETLDFAREEFKRNKDKTDIVHIRYLISTGKTQWETMERYIDGI